MKEGKKVMTIVGDRGPVLVSTDLHGNLADFERLRDLFLESCDRGEQPLWLSVGDWVHGPSPERDDITDSEGQPLYDYPDETPALLEQLFALMERFPDQVHSVCGNHEHAHIGGMRTSKFHRDEVAFLEGQLTPARVTELRRRFAAWPMMIRLAPCGVVITHGAPAPAAVDELERVRYRGNADPRSAELMRSAMTRYGFRKGEDVELLARLSEPGQDYRVLVHGHDREETGYAPTGEAALLLCTSFGARHAFKTYAWLDRAARYRSLADLCDGSELRRLWGHLTR